VANICLLRNLYRFVPIPENLHLRDARQVGILIVFFADGDVDKGVYLSMYRELPCFKFQDRADFDFCKGGARISTI
jgi:hypothetical protein